MSDLISFECGTESPLMGSSEVMPHIRSEVISGKYVVQYIFAAAATAAVEPLINSIGVGWTFTICKSGDEKLPCLSSSSLTPSRRCICDYWRFLCVSDH